MSSGGNRFRGLQKHSSLEKPLITIITVVYNRVKYLEQSILSVLNQTYDNIEYIVIDGGSIDGTLAIIKKYDEFIDYWISEPDGGIYFALNKGINLANGELIGVCHSDDFLFSRYTISLIVKANSRYKADIYHGDQLMIEDFPTMSKFRRQTPERDIRKLNYQPTIFHTTCFFRKRIFDKVGLYDTSYRIIADYDFLLRCLENNCPFEYIPEIITGFRAGGKSGSCKIYKESFQLRKIHDNWSFQQILFMYLKCYFSKWLNKLYHFR